MFITSHYRTRFRASWNHSRSSHHISFIYTLISCYIPTNDKVFQKFFLPCFPNKILYSFYLSMCASTRLVDLTLLNSIAYFRYWHIQLQFFRLPQRRFWSFMSSGMSHWSPWSASPLKTKELRSFETLSATHPKTQPHTSGDLNPNLHFATDFSRSDLLKLLMICATLTSS